jgi:hypothetical protein
MNPIPERPTPEETRSRAKALEKQLKSLIDGQLTVSSGNKRDKGDARSRVFRGEAKYRWAWDQGFYLPLDLSWIETIYYQAEKAHQIPVLALEWGSGVRAYLVSTRDYDYNVFSIDPHDEHSGRVIEISDTDAHRHLCLPKLKIQQMYWVSLDQSDFRDYVLRMQPR